MAKQLLIDATRGKQTEMPPWLPYAGVHCAALIDQPADAFLKDAALLAQGVVNAAELYHADGIPLVTIGLMEARDSVKVSCRQGCRLSYVVVTDGEWERKTATTQANKPVTFGVAEAASGSWPVGELREVQWLDLDNVDAPGDDLRHRAQARGAAIFT